MLVATGFLAVLLSPVLTLSTPNIDDQDICDKYSAVNGSDTARGTSYAPFRTAQKLVDSLEPGQTGCLHAGTYVEADNTLTISNGGAPGQRVVIRGAPNEQATLLGRLYIAKGANWVTVRNMVLDGSASPADVNCTTTDGGCGLLPSPTVNGDHVQFIGNKVTNQHTGICFVLGSHTFGIAYGTLIQENYIHGCGRLPSMNHDHGIYVEAARDTSIIGNWIYDNADRGIQLYPDAQSSVIQSNVIDGNGEGIIFSGDETYVSSFNEVKNNVISNSQVRWLVEESWPSSYHVGFGNTVHDNCVWPTNPNSYYNQNNGIMPNARGFIAYNNLSEDLCI